MIFGPPRADAAFVLVLGRIRPNPREPAFVAFLAASPTPHVVGQLAPSGDQGRSQVNPPSRSAGRFHPIDSMALDSMAIGK